MSYKPDDPKTMIANCLYLHCRQWIEPRSDDLEAAATVIIAYLAGAGYQILHEDKQIQLTLEGADTEDREAA